MNNVIIIFILFFTYISCAPMPEETGSSSISIRFPKSSKSIRSDKTSRRALVAGSSYGISDITTLDDIDCYAVAIGFPDTFEIGPGTCSSDNGVVPNLRMISETVGDGEEITMTDVPVGTDRSFFVIGFSTSLATCPDFKSLQFSDLGTVSRPSIVGIKNQTLIADIDNIIDITISMNDVNFVNSCQGGPFLWQVGGTFDSAAFDGAVFGP